MIERAVMLMSPAMDQIQAARREAEVVAYVARLERQFRDEREAFIRVRYGTMDERDAARAGADEYVERRTSLGVSAYHRRGCSGLWP